MEVAPMVKQVEVNGEQVIIVGDFILVASKSEPATWHEVRVGACDCKSFQYRGVCRHVTAVAELTRST
jgi:SWIM zinc finger